MIRYIDPEYGWQLGHPIVREAQASSSGATILAQVEVGCSPTDLAQSVGYVASRATTSTGAWQYVNK